MSIARPNWDLINRHARTVGARSLLTGLYCVIAFGLTAASVAVAKPEYIEPMTSMTSIITGISSFDSLIFSRNVIRASAGGTSCFLNTDHSATYPMNIPARTKPGIMPAMKSLEIDSLMVTP